MNSKEMLQKALDTNIGQSPPIDKSCQTTLQIDALNYEISQLRIAAWGGMVDMDNLMAKIAVRDSLIENLKTEKLR